MQTTYRALMVSAAVATLLFPLWAASNNKRTIRVTGNIEATRSLTIKVPIMQGQGGNLTLVRLAANGTAVHEGDLLAEFDNAAQIKTAREAQAKYDDLSHQVEQSEAEHKSNVEKRRSELESAQADLKKAAIEIRKGPILSEIDQQKNAVKLEDAKAHVDSLNKSGAAHDIAEIAATKVLMLQRDRQKVAIDRQNANMQKLSLRAPISGMVALQNVYRNNSMGHAQEGDQLWPGSPLLQLFDPKSMQVALSVGEPDGKVLKPGTVAQIHIDAFPNLVLPAHYDSASPVASSSLMDPIKSFNARFMLDRTDKRLVPDLSASAEIEVTE